MKVQYIREHKDRLRASMLVTERMSWAKEWELDPESYTSIVDKVLGMTPQEIDETVDTYQRTADNLVTNSMEVTLQLLLSVNYYIAGAAKLE